MEGDDFNTEAVMNICGKLQTPDARQPSSDCVSYQWWRGALCQPPGASALLPGSVNTCDRGALSCACELSACSGGERARQ